MSWKETVTARRPKDVVAAIRLLSTMVGFRHVCYKHMKSLAAHAGLMVKTLNHAELRERLQIVHEHRETLGALKTANETFRWFRRKHRPTRPSDRLGPYQFAGQDSAGAFTYDQRRTRRLPLAKDISTAKSPSLQNFQTCGSLQDFW